MKSPFSIGSRGSTFGVTGGRRGHRARGRGQALVAQVEVVADRDHGRLAKIGDGDHLVAGAGDHGGQFGRADDQHARGTESLGDDLAEDLERRERVLDPGQAEPVELGADVASGGAGIVGEEGHPAARVVQRGQRLTRPGIEHLALPDAAVEIEDEAAAVGEHRARSPDDRLNSAIASAYTCSVRSATEAQEVLLHAPAAGLAHVAREVGVFRTRARASASAAGWAGGTSSPVLPSSTTSRMPPTAEATTGASQAIASRLMRPNGS